MELQNMVRMNKSKRYAAIAGFLAGIALSGTAAMAETHHDRPDRATERGAVVGHSISSDQSETPQGTALNTDVQQKLDRMADNCNRMMQSMMQSNGSAPAQKG